ncbi:DNA adenine methylase [Anaerocolumna sp. MB42-C2]|uniref:DNA adenine methylase n=1 Tax=Anaerocolumna sp. MB42-C2 TaxID=3070997 RepID=UPI0027E16419|nr:DNA adenine methylase [Anaerocolumna sp. MB42-C2]WMJ85476.1 DNA adenine methylase [Anaerocolumna sp. MB42-C2]
MPKHHSYLEPYFGGGAILLNKEPSRIETINDLDDDVINLFVVIQDDSTREELIGQVVYTPYARAAYDNSFPDNSDELDPVERAKNFLIRSGMGYGFRHCEKTGWKRDVYAREAAYAVRYWNDLPEVITAVAQRLKMVQIEHRPAVELIKSFNHSNVLIYNDPPYLFSTRSRKMYKHEMGTDAEHIEMLEALLQHTGPVMLSGYDNEIYNTYLSGWRKESIPARAERSLPRTEYLWMNY